MDLDKWADFVTIGRGGVAACGHIKKVIYTQREKKRKAEEALQRERNYKDLGLLLFGLMAGLMIFRS